MTDGFGNENGSSRDNSSMFSRQSDISRLPSTATGSVAEVDSFSKDPESAKKKIKVAEHEKSSMEVENAQQAAVTQGTSSSEMRPQETVYPMPSGPHQSYFQGDTRRITPEIHRTEVENLNRNSNWEGQGSAAFAGNRQHLNQEVAVLMSKESPVPSSSHHVPADGCNSNIPEIDQIPGTAGTGNAVENCSHEIVPDQSADEGYEDLSEHDDLPSSPPKYTMTEKWILSYQKRRYDESQKRVLEQQKVHSRMSASYEKLKVSYYPILIVRA